MVELIGKELQFELGTEWHSDTNEIWYGYIVSIEPKEAAPGECLLCKNWFRKEDKRYYVKERYVEGSPEGHGIRVELRGFICEKCLNKVKEEKEFMGAKQKEKK